MQKQRISNADFIRLREESKAIPRSEVDRLVNVALERLHEHRDKRLACSWSGGKDSIALEFITRQAGIKLGVLGVCNLEYPAFERWLLDHLPEGFEVYNSGQDLPWLLRNPKFLFPDTAHASRWFTIVQRKAQMEYCQKYAVDLLMLGRRREDGNVMGPDGMHRRGTQMFFAPIHDWTHQQVFALIEHYKLPMPPIYGWPNGYVCGTHPWPARQHCQSEAHGWEEIYTIDRNIVERMAKHYDQAKECLQRHEG